MKTRKIIFNEKCSAYDPKDWDYNYMWIRQTELFCNDLLRYRGYLFVSDVMARLGVKPKRSELLAGWVWKKEYDYYPVIQFEVFKKGEDITLVLLNVEDDISYAFEE